MRGFFTIKIWDCMTNYDLLSLYLLLIKDLFHIISIFKVFFNFFVFFLLKNFRVGGKKIGTVGKPETQVFFFRPNVRA